MLLRRQPAKETPTKAVVLRQDKLGAASFRHGAPPRGMNARLRGLGRDHRRPGPQMKLAIVDIEEAARNEPGPDVWHVQVRNRYGLARTSRIS
jgi:hypothetical protein